VEWRRAIAREDVLRGVPVYTALLKAACTRGGRVGAARQADAFQSALGARAAVPGAPALSALATQKCCWRPTFNHFEGNLELAAKLSVAGLHLDLGRAPEQLEGLLEHVPDADPLSSRGGGTV